MKKKIILLSGVVALFSCGNPQGKKTDLTEQIQGTWQLIDATTVDHGIKTVTDFTKNQRMIKIMNKTHFSFLRKSLDQESANVFDAGGGSYTIDQNHYKEHLDFYKDKNWQGKSFDFTIRFIGDTLIQEGRENIPESGTDRVITERYIRLK